MMNHWRKKISDQIWIQNLDTFRWKFLTNVPLSVRLVGLFVCSSVVSLRKILEIADQFALIFCMNIEIHKERKVMEPNFLKKSSDKSGGL